MHVHILFVLSPHFCAISLNNSITSIYKRGVQITTLLVQPRTLAQARSGADAHALKHLRAHMKQGKKCVNWPNMGKCRVQTTYSILLYVGWLLDLVKVESLERNEGWSTGEVEGMELSHAVTKWNVPLNTAGSESHF